jgi:predicted  nucleic acid-binding Zn-ribbon protein
LVQLPFRTINFTDSTDKSRHDQIVELVERMQLLNKHLLEARTSSNMTVLQQEITATDQQIDKLVYELYELSDDEISTVEELTSTNAGTKSITESRSHKVSAIQLTSS